MKSKTVGIVIRHFRRNRHINQGDSEANNQRERTMVRMVMSPMALVCSTERVFVVKSTIISPLFMAFGIGISSPVAGFR